MRVNFAVHYGRKTLARALTAAVVASWASITFAEATSYPDGRNDEPTNNQVFDYPGLSKVEPWLNYHDFVINAAGESVPQSSDDKAVCLGRHLPKPHQIVVDPIARSGSRSQRSLDQIVSGLPGSEVSVVFLRSGIYHLSRPVMITALSGALTIQACPGETPVIEAAAGEHAIVLKDSRLSALIGLVFAGPSPSHVVLDGAVDCLIERSTFLQGNTGITLDHARQNRIVQNVIRGVASTGIELKDGSDNNLVADNIVDGANAQETFGGGIFLHGARDNRIAHNMIRQTAGFGIAVSNWDNATINVGNVIEFNLLRDTVRDSADSGAIYVLGRSGGDTGIVIANNVIDGFGSDGNHNVGIYLDDSTSGATVVGNLIRAPGSDAVQIHGGQDNLIENNLFDLGEGQSSALLFQAAPADTQPANRQTGNVVIRNIILSSNPRPRPFVWYDGGTPVVSGNFYALLRGAVISNESPVVDQLSEIGDTGLVGTGSEPDYGPAQAAAQRAIGFTPLDLQAAGVRRRP